jgi:rhodanese-related sulfurtransferase
MSLLARLLGTASTPSLDAAQAQAKLGQHGRKPLLLDVRQPEEYREGHIPGATLIPLGDLASRMNDLPKDREIICVCRSGNRSGSATQRLRAAGYNAVNLQGGMISWSRSGYPVATGARR